MKLTELFEVSTPKIPSRFCIKNAHGTLNANLKGDLEDEEDEGYIPVGYNKTVVELAMVKAVALGAGHGASLMNEFLNSSFAKQAELIFLDPSPDEGLFDKLDETEEVKIEKLHRFYAKFGFRKNPRSNRMWLVQKGKIPDNELPT